MDAAALAREAYAAAPEKFRAPDTFDLRHVLIKTTDRAEPEARALIDKVHAEAVAHPDRFAELAKRYSEDQSNSANGGILRGRRCRDPDPGLRRGRAGARPRLAQISPVVQTPYGLHVIQLVARQPGAQRSFESVQAELEAQVAAEAAGRWAQREIERLQNIPAQTDDTVANSIRTRYGTTATDTP